MSALKQEFHEVLAGEYGAIADLETAYRAAYDAYFALHDRLPVYRNHEQQEALNAAYRACEWAKWKLDSAKGWESLSRRRA